MGIPSKFGYGPNEPRITLKTFLDTYESELVDGFYTITVSGKLPFNQDLVNSKLTTFKDIYNAVKNNFPDDESATTKGDNISHIGGDFALLRKQIKNGIITSDILNAIRKIATNKEIKDFLNLEVVSAVYYSAKNRVDTIEEWIDIVLNSKGELKSKDGLPVDNRTKVWCSIPVENFISPLLEARNKTKADKTNQQLSTEKREQAAAKDYCLKLLINTLYGVFASPFFSIGNTVVANNITAKARLNVWMLAKALKLYQVITDGGFYSYNDILFLNPNGKRPGLAALSNISNLDKHKSIKKGTLKDDNGNTLTWDKIKDSVKSKGSKDIDRWAKTHVNNFWSNYDLKLNFQLEHKAENTSPVISYWGKGHYAFKNIGGNLEYKIRGTKQYENEEDKTHSPMYDILKSIVDGDLHPQIKDMNHTHTLILKIGKHLDIQKSKGYVNQKHYRPGDLVVEDRTLRLNNTHVHLENEAQLNLRKNRKKFRTVNGKKIPCELYERFLPEGIDTLHKKLLNNSTFHRKAN